MARRGRRRVDADDRSAKGWAVRGRDCARPVRRTDSRSPAIGTGRCPSKSRRRHLSREAEMPQDAACRLRRLEGRYEAQPATAAWTGEDVGRKDSPHQVGPAPASSGRTAPSRRSVAPCQWRQRPKPVPLRAARPHGARAEDRKHLGSTRGRRLTESGVGPLCDVWSAFRPLPAARRRFARCSRQAPTTASGTGKRSSCIAERRPPRPPAPSLMEPPQKSLPPQGLRN